MKKENKENKENKEIIENTEINSEIPNTEIQNNMDIVKEYFEIQKEISDKTKKGDFQGIVNLLKQKEEIIQKYTEIQKQKEEEKKQKLQEIENKIQNRITQIDLIKEEIRELKEEKKQIQGYNTDNNNNSTRIINRISHKYTWNSINTDKAIDIIYMVLSEYGISENSWKEFNQIHSISWHDFIEKVKNNKYPQKNNLIELFNNNTDNLNQFYEHVKEITIS